MLPLLKGQNGGRDFIASGLGGRSTSFVGEVENEDHLTNRKFEFPPGGGFNWRMVVKQMNATSTLKLVCCPTGCGGIIGNTTLFPQSTGVSAQLGLFEIGSATLKVEADLLTRGVGHSEAAEMVKILPSVAKQACTGILSRMQTLLV